MTPEERLKRWAQKNKFNATFSHELDNAVVEYLESVPDSNPELDWEFIEVGEFGSGNWTIAYSHKSKEKDQKKDTINKEEL